MNDLISDHSDAHRATSLSPTPPIGQSSPVQVSEEQMDIEQPAPLVSPYLRQARPSRSQQQLTSSFGRRSGRLLVEQDKEKDMDLAVASISSLLRGSPTVSRFHPNGGVSAPGSAPPTKTTFHFAPYSSGMVSPAPIPQQMVPNKGNYTSNAMLLGVDDSTRSFSQRRRRRSGARNLNEPPPPLTIPTLPSSFAIPALVPRSGGGAGYVSRRESHSPRSGGGWKSRRSSPPSIPVDALQS